MEIVDKKAVSKRKYLSTKIISLILYLDLKVKTIQGFRHQTVDNSDTVFVS